MICGHCRNRDVDVPHVRACSAARVEVEQSQVNPAHCLSSRVLSADMLKSFGIEAGRYAIYDSEGVLQFYRLDMPSEGRWAGYAFLSQQVSDNFFPVRAVETRKYVLVKIAISPQNAMLRYGKQLGICGHCGRTLTNEDSRKIGIGPVCAQKIGAAA